MNIGIIGAGSIGLLFAAYLNNAFNITIYSKTTEQANLLNQRGLTLQKRGTEVNVKVQAVPISEWTGKDDLTIVAVKQYQLDSVITKLNNQPVMPKQLLFLQNGMGHLKLLENVEANQIFLASVEHGALKINATTVRHNGEGAIYAAVYKGDQEKLQAFSQASPAEFPIFLKDHYVEMLVNKLIANAVINPLTAILQVENGELIDNFYYFTVLKKLFSELSFVLNLDDPDRHIKNIITICKNTATNRSSMLKDLDTKQITEVDAILGFVIEEAKKQGKDAPLIESYYNMLKGKEREWGDNS
ncbi:2-dehydropantoate 2-reductase [Neobacillus sp. K501]